MYPLGDNFKLKVNPTTNQKNIIRGNKYRISILTERLIRFEYNESGIFEDLPTEFAWNRNFPDVNYSIKQDSKFLEITTSYFKISYTKEKSFKGSKISPDSNLKVEILNSNSVWYYGHPEVKNYGAPSSEINSSNSKIKFSKSLYSLDGFASFNDSNSKVVEEDGTLRERKEKEIDIYLFAYLKDFTKALKDYFYLTGYPALIPRYALGNWWSRHLAYDDNSLKKLIDNFERKNVPLSIFLLDNDWHTQIEGKEAGFTFNKKLFAAPYEMISYVHNKGIKLGLSVNPTEGFYSNDEFYQQAKKYLQADEKGTIPFNALSPRFIDVYLKLYIHPLDALEVDFYWIKNSSKTTDEELTMLKHYHIYDMMRNYKRRPMILAKGTSLASHRYPVLYAGKTTVSWDSLALMPFYNLNATNIGVTFWSHDIGGYYKGIEDNELYIRFVQLGTFSPILKFGSDGGKYYKREPWRWGVKTYTIVKDYLTLRHQLIPYLYSEAYKYHKFGDPMLIPLYYKYPEMYDDDRYSKEYYFGSELFIAPITKKKDYTMDRSIHKMYIPEGVWYDFVTGKKFPGGKDYVGFFKDQDYPVFAKAGAIIPLAISEKINDTNPPQNMEIHVFPGRSNSYNIYEDDGTTDLYLKDYYLLTNIEYNYSVNDYKLVMKSVEGKSGIVPDTRHYKFRFRNTKEPSKISVTFNGSPLRFMTYVDINDYVVEIPEVNSIGNITINLQGDNLEVSAMRIVNDDIAEIISDLQIETEIKNSLDKVLFGELSNKKKRIEIRKLKAKGLDKKYMKLFLKLLEYVDEV